MTDKKQTKNKKEKYEKLKIIGKKQAIIYWILAVLSIIGIIIYMNWFGDYFGKGIDESGSSSNISSSSAMVTYQSYI